MCAECCDTTAFLTRTNYSALPRAGDSAFLAVDCRLTAVLPPTVYTVNYLCKPSNPFLYLHVFPAYFCNTSNPSLGQNILLVRLRLVCQPFLALRYCAKAFLLLKTRRMEYEVRRIPGPICAHYIGLRTPLQRIGTPLCASVKACVNGP
jgi:hypothetical protein